MKILLIIIGVSISLFSMFQLISMKSTKNTEMYSYTILKDFGTFEIRKYAPANFTYVKMNSNSYESMRTEGFRKLAGYIFGGNNKNQKIAMTTPVATSLTDTPEMQFMIPASENFNKMPEPNDKDVHFKQETEKLVAAIRFSGWATDEKIKIYTAILRNELQKNNIQFTNKISLLGYNPPYELLNRRNEIIIELDANLLNLN